MVLTFEVRSTENGTKTFLMCELRMGLEWDLKGSIKRESFPLILASDPALL